MEQWKENLEKSFEDTDRWNYNGDTYTLRDTKHRLEFKVYHERYLTFKNTVIMADSDKLKLLVDSLKNRNLRVKLSPLMEAYGGEA